MGINSQLEIVAFNDSCTGSAAPFSSCTAANTGTCTMRITFGGTGIGGSTAVTAAHHETTNVLLGNNASTSAQTYNYNNIASSVQNGTGTASISTATNVNILVTMQNSVSGDTCWLGGLNVTMIP